MRFLIFGRSACGRIEKKNWKKKSQEVSEQEAPVAQDDVMLLCCYYAHFSDQKIISS